MVGEGLTSLHSPSSHYLLKSFTGAEVKMNHMASGEGAAGREKGSAGPRTGLLPGCSSGEEA